MKKVFRVSVIVGLTILLSLGISAACLGAAHGINSWFVNHGTPSETPFPSDYSNLAVPGFDGWFFVEPTQPYIKATAAWCIDDPLYTFDYYFNEQTFINLNYLLPESGDSAVNLTGSYLWKRGIFCGLDYYTYDDYNDSIISPGYRFNIGDKGYVGFSVDYRSTNINWYDDGVIGYELDSEYYRDNLAFYGAIYLAEGDDELEVETELDYRLAEKLVAGVILGHADDENGFTVGMTCTPSQWVIDGKYGYEANEHYYQLNGVYYFTKNFGGGLEYAKEGKEEEVLTYKLRYLNDKFCLTMFYSEQDNAGEKFYFEYDFKI